MTFGACHCESQDGGESLAKGAPIASILSSPACTPSRFLATLAESTLEEQAEILSRLDRLIDLDRMVILELQKSSKWQDTQRAPRQVPQATTRADSPKEKVETQVTVETSDEMILGSEDRDPNLARGGPLPRHPLLGSPKGFLSTLANSSWEKQKQILMGLEELIAQESMADVEKSKAPNMSVSSRRTNSNRSLCSSTRLVRAVRSRPYRGRKFNRSKVR
eukprot:gnl/MRDRNA2_/MRDRNA2_88655_c0_seq1.p1 gnl/MRDRNA2_/MRDRNA2_88655_c0~~gnl/MRDRNA2_/MRDRNA2_88655_c0_seq1.p1  ORF type:complete len:220 (-),score=38.88 gnl/MRDRNA2_/MRDRNA2_88655_c0_seq1:189-848(-)